MFILFRGFWKLLMSQRQRNIKPIKLIASYQMLHHSTNNWPWGYIDANKWNWGFFNNQPLLYKVRLVVFPTKTLHSCPVFLVLASMSNPNKHPNVPEERNLPSKSGPSNHHQVAAFSPGKTFSVTFSLASWRLATNLWDAMEGSTFYTKNHGTYGGWNLGQPKKDLSGVMCWVVPPPMWQMKVYLLESWTGWQPKLCEL